MRASRVSGLLGAPRRRRPRAAGAVGDHNADSAPRNRNTDRPSDSKSESEPAPESVLSSRLLEAVAKIGSPIAIGTALLFYFGWVRADTQARALGYDVTLLGLTTTDFVLRSVGFLFVPIVGLLLLAVICYMAHPALLRLLEHAPSSRGAKTLVVSLRSAWLWCPLAGIVIFVLSPQARAFVIPFALSIAIAIAMYGDWLHRHLSRCPPRRPAITGLVLALLAVTLFWDVERVAGMTGRNYAAYISESPNQFAKITIYSPTSLEMSAPLIVERPIGTDKSAYRYRYDGLRLMLHSSDKYFLLAYGPVGQKPVVVVLPDNDQIRVEFTQ